MDQEEPPTCAHHCSLSTIHHRLIRKPTGQLWINDELEKLAPTAAQRSTGFSADLQSEPYDNEEESSSSLLSSGG